MATLDWRKKQKKGVTIKEPNENICREYLQSAEFILTIKNIIKPLRMIK